MLFRASWLSVDYDVIISMRADKKRQRFIFSFRN